MMKFMVRSMVKHSTLKIVVSNVLRKYCMSSTLLGREHYFPASATPMSGGLWL